MQLPVLGQLESAKETLVRIAAWVNPAINLDMLVLQRLADNIVRTNRFQEGAIDGVGYRFADIIVAAIGPIRKSYGRRILRRRRVGGPGGVPESTGTAAMPYSSA